MIIVAGSLRVAPEGRSAYLQGCRAVVEQARAAPGCLDFSISADLVDEARINVYERWDSEGALARFRGSGPSEDQVGAILRADVADYTLR